LRLGAAPKDKIFSSYVQLELQLGNLDRCRTIYERWLQWSPSSCNAWVKFAHLEKDLDEIERCRAIFELATSQPLLDMPEILWKAYIDFEIEQEEYERTRNLYKRLLERTKHVKVWISFAQFEASISNYDGTRQIFNQAYQTLKTSDSKEEV
jgi:crooked neck